MFNEHTHTHIQTIFSPSWMCVCAIHETRKSRGWDFDRNKNSTKRSRYVTSSASVTSCNEQITKQVSLWGWKLAISFSSSRAVRCLDNKNLMSIVQCMRVCVSVYAILSASHREYTTKRNKSPLVCGASLRKAQQHCTSTRGRKSRLITRCMRLMLMSVGLSVCSWTSKEEDCKNLVLRGESSKESFVKT